MLKESRRNTTGPIPEASAAAAINVSRPTFRPYRTLILSFAVFLCIIGAITGIVGAQTADPLASSTIGLINQLAGANRQSFYLYKNASAGEANGFPSGFFPAGPVLTKIHIDTACVYDGKAANGCSTDTTRLDRTRGTVLRVTIDQLAPGEFGGINIEEPENYGASNYGIGYDLRGATRVCFDALQMTATGKFQFTVAGIATPFTSFGNTWTPVCYNFADLGLAQPDIANVHLLFGIQTNDVNDASLSGATLLLDNIRFEPVPSARASTLSFPLANEIFGNVPAADVQPGRVPIPPDQVLGTQTTAYESALALRILIADGSSQSLVNARQIADAFVYAVGPGHDNSGLPLPIAPDGSRPIRNGTSSGTVSLNNDQKPNGSAGAGGLKGQIRLAGFNIASNLCGPTHFCVVQDGISGGNASFVILGMLAAWQQFQDPRYLDAARDIGNWIYGSLLDKSGTGIGGYFIGFPDQGLPKILQTGKSVENLADIFAAMSRLGDATLRIGFSPESTEWNRRAKIAGDAAMALFEPVSGRFYAGSVPVGTPASPGIQPDGPQKGNDVFNTADFMDSETFTTLALAASPLYRDAIDWRRPAHWMLSHFAQKVTSGGQQFQGFDIVSSPSAGPNGIMSEFTGQAIVTLRFVDALYNETSLEAQATAYLAQLRVAQSSAPFGDGRGLVAAIMDGGDTLPPYQQCLSSPFQCAAERVGLAATSWAWLASRNISPFADSSGAPLIGAFTDAATSALPVSPGALFALYGANLSSRTSSPSSVPLSTVVNGTKVTINGVDAPLLFVSPGQINGQIPWSLSSGSATVRVSGSSGASNPFAFSLSAVSPSFFQDSSGNCIAQLLDGSLISQSNPVKDLAYAVIYLDGIGPVDNPVATGAVTPLQPLSRATSKIQATIAGQPATIVFLGLTPGLVGVAQANLLIPAGIASGGADLVLTVSGIASSPCRLYAGDTVAPPPPSIARIAPNSGSAAGNTTVVVTGQGFRSGLILKLGGKATSATVLDDKTIRFVTPAGSGVVNLDVTNPDGQSATLSNAFTYQVPPTISGINPAFGAAVGGTPTTITGTGFVSGLTVRFGSNAASNVIVLSPTSIQANAPAGSGSVDVTVTNPDNQSAVLSSGYRYQAGPAITAVSPVSGSAAGGTSITISGTGFVSGLTLQIGNIDILSFTVADTNTIRAVTPPGTGAVNITVINPDRQLATLVNAFSFLGSPLVSGISPSSGPAAGGTPITVSGSGFVSGLTLKIGTTNAQSVEVVSPATIRAITPPGSGTVALTVTNPDGQSGSLNTAFTYQPAPVINGISPSTGSVRGGTSVSVFGSGFLPGATVMIGGASATSVLVGSANTLQALTPAGNGTVGVSVTNPDSQSAFLNSAFTYRASPLITGVSPAVGSNSGGTQITVSGSGFIAGLTLSIGGVSARSVVVSSANSIHAVTPPGSGTVGVSVTDADGQSASLSNAFTYQAPVVGANPTITGSVQQNQARGSVTGVTPPDAFKVVVYAFTNAYFIQPCTFESLNTISPSGSWGPVDLHNGTIFAFLVASAYNPPTNPASLPAIDHVNVLAASGPIGTAVGADVARCPAL